LGSVMLKKKTERQNKKSAK
jgi:hypothetical protein